MPRPRWKPCAPRPNSKPRPELWLTAPPLAAAQRLKQRGKAVVVDFVHQRQQLAEAAGRKADAGEPGEVMAGQVGDQTPLVFAVRHRLGHQSFKVFGFHRIRQRRAGAFHTATGADEGYADLPSPVPIQGIERLAWLSLASEPTIAPHHGEERNAMQAPTQMNELDDATLAFAEQVFDSARNGDSSRLDQLLGQGMPPNLRNHAGDSLLMLASYHAHLAATRVLLEHGADPQLRNHRGHTPLAGAAFKGDLAMVELLLEHGADVESRCEDGKTALMMAAMFNRTAVVTYLIAQGADPHARDASGATALTAARLMGAVDTEAMLRCDEGQSD